MKNIFREKSLILAVIFITLIVTYYLFQTGRVSFFPLRKTGEHKIFSEILFKEKEYKLDYKDRPQSSVIEIARFESNENWVGDGYFDDRIFKEGKSSYILTSRNHQESVVVLDKKLDLKEAVTFKFLVYVETKPSDIETFNLVLTNKGLDQTCQFPFRNLKEGWNLLVFPKEQLVLSLSEEAEPTTEFVWDNIDEVKFELISRPKKRSTVSLDFLWTEATADYLQDWNTDSPDFLSLGKDNDELTLLLISFGRKLVVLKEIISARNYTFQAKLTPLGRGRFGLFLRGDYKSGYGYYFIMDGVDKNSWQIFKTGIFDDKLQTSVLASGEIAGFQVEQNRSYWLKGQVNGSNLVFELSLDGKDFSRLGQVSDWSFQVGNVGIMAEEQLTLVDDLLFFQ